MKPGITLGEFKTVLQQEIRKDTQWIREKVVPEVAARAVARVVKATDDAELVDTGAYKQSWRFVQDPDGAEVLNDAPHAAVIEWGRRPGKRPPLEPLMEWVRRKFAGQLRAEHRFVKAIGLGLVGSGRDRASSQKRGQVRRAVGRQGDYVEQQIRAIALKIQARIGVRGQAPKFVLQGQIIHIGQDLQEAVVRAMRRRRNEGSGGGGA